MSTFRFAAYALSIIVVVVTCWCIYKYVMNKKEHFNEHKKTLLFFYADWCPHCTNFKPEVLKFKQQNEANKQLEVKMLEESACPPELMKKHNVRGFPTVVLVTVDGAGQEHADTYNGERSSDGLQHFIDSATR